MASSREDKKKFIGDLLKAADRYIKAAEYTDAMIEVNKALAVEPGNMYALAYNQRIKSALEGLRKKEDAARVKKITEEKNAVKTGKSPAAAEAATEDEAAVESPEEVRVPERTLEEPRPSVTKAKAPPAPAPGPVSNEEDLYTIRQQQAQIERFKEEIESLRVRHQQEIAVLARDIQQAHASEKEAKDKYRVVVDDAEESYRRTEELYAEVVRLNERLGQSKRSDDERDALAALHQLELQRMAKKREEQGADNAADVRRLEEERRLEREQLAAGHAADVRRLEEERRLEREQLAAGHAAHVQRIEEDRGLERERLEEERERLTADHRIEVLRLGSEAETLTEVHHYETLQLKEDLRRVRDELAQTEQKLLAAASSAPAALSTSNEAPTGDEEHQRRTIGESFLRTILDTMLKSETLTADAREMMNILRTEIGMSEEDFGRLQTGAKHRIYRSALAEAWEDGYITPEKAELLAQLRRKIGVSPESHFMIEDELRDAKKSR